MGRFRLCCRIPVGSKSDLDRVCTHMPRSWDRSWRPARTDSSWSSLEVRSTRLTRTPDRNNYTSELADYVTSIAPMLEDVSGFILTERSPSCGLHGVKLYEPGTDRFRRNGTGIFAASLRSHYPNLPLADSGDLSAGSSTDLFLRRAVFHYVFVRSNRRRPRRTAVVAERYVVWGRANGLGAHRHHCIH